MRDLYARAAEATLQTRSILYLFVAFTNLSGVSLVDRSLLIFTVSTLLSLSIFTGIQSIFRIQTPFFSCTFHFLSLTQLLCFLSDGKEKTEKSDIFLFTITGGSYKSITLSV